VRQGHKPLVFTKHAQTVQLERGIETVWIVRVLANPDWTTPDPNDGGLHRAFGAIAERDNRILRVVFSVEPDRIRVISVFFDRNAERPQ
jgi:uncharacterized DUF497 family protein